MDSFSVGSEVEDMVLGRSFVFGVLMGLWPAAGLADDATEVHADQSAQTAAEPAVQEQAAHGSDAEAPSGVLRLGGVPSLDETGRVAVPDLLGGNAHGASLDGALNLAPLHETDIHQPALAVPERPGKSGAPSKALERQIEAHLAALRDCRIDVARRRRVPLAELGAGELLLRWTIAAGGTVSDTNVVAQGAVDLLLMNCVKRQMSTWTFTGPRGGALRVTRTYRF